MRSGPPARATLLILSLTLASAGALFALAGVAAGQSSPSPSPAGDVALGRSVYQERCASCHGDDAAGTVQGPDIRGLGPAYYDFMMSTGRMPLDQPSAQLERRRPVLSPEEIHAVTDYLVALTGPGLAIPRVDVRAGDISDGEKVYQANCAPCHGTSGNGGAVGVVDAPDVHHATITQIAEAIRIGPGTMPRFDEATVDQGDLDAIVRYVVYLRNPDDRGGANLNHVGPLIEGFVAIGLGLGLIVIVTRWIGTRA